MTDTLFLPPLKQVPSPNFSGRAGVPVDLIVAHDCEGSYAGSISWFAQSKSQVSAHIVLNEDGTEATQMVPFTAKAWHACNINFRSIGIEIAGYSKAGFSPSELNADANIISYLMHRFNIPCQESDGTKPGVASHYMLGANGGGHTDITTDPAVWAAFFARVKAAYSAWEVLPSLPAWGLTGFASSAVVSPTPSAPADYVPVPDPARKGPVSPVAAVSIPAWPPASHPMWVRGAQIVNALRAKGAENPLIIAALANGYAESCFTPKAIGDNNHAYNVWQWWWSPRGERIFAATGIDVRSEPSISKIVDALWWELENVYPNTLTKLKSATNGEDAARIFCAEFEGAGAPNAVERRAMEAAYLGVWLSKNEPFISSNPAT